MRNWPDLQWEVGQKVLVWGDATTLSRIGTVLRLTPKQVIVMGPDWNHELRFWRNGFQVGPYRHLSARPATEGDVRRIERRHHVIAVQDLMRKTNVFSWSDEDLAALEELLKRNEVASNG